MLNGNKLKEQRCKLNKKNGNKRYIKIYKINNKQNNQF